MQVMSWGELMIIILIAWIAWYGFVLLKYFPKGFVRRKVTASTTVKWTREKLSDNLAATPSPSLVSEHDTHAQVHECMQEIKLIFGAAIRDQLVKEQIFESIAKRLQKYSTLPTSIQQSINQHLISEFSLQLKITVTLEEISALWK